MAHWHKLLLGTSLAILFSGPLYANPTQPPADAAPVSEPAVVAEAPAEPSQCAETGGLPEETQAKISLYYPFPVASIAPDGKALRATSEGGLMLVDGVQYTLQYIELPKHAELPFSSVQYPMEARFVHRAADGSIAILSVPVAEGSANIALEKMLQKKGMRADPNDLLPASRDITLMGQERQGGCNGPVERHYVMTTPVQVSAAQIKKFEQLF
jgi:carbonic anhydrase